MTEWIKSRRRGIITIIIATVLALIYLSLKDRPGKPPPAQVKEGASK